MFEQTIANDSHKNAWTILLFIFFFWVIFSILATYRVVPLWYVVTYPFAGLIGLILAKKTYTITIHETTTT